MITPTMIVSIGVGEVTLSHEHHAEAPPNTTKIWANNMLALLTRSRPVIGQKYFSTRTRAHFSATPPAVDLGPTQSNFVADKEEDHLLGVGHPFQHPTIILDKGMEAQELRSVTVVNDLESADKALKVLYAHKDLPHACSVETMDLDTNSQTPVGNGSVLCLTIFVTTNVEFGNGPRLFIDNLNHPALKFFKQYFEEESIKKIWHGYGVSRHVLHNHGIDAKGFGGDTTHMARLLDPTREDYSLDSLSHMLAGRRKVSMMERFGVHPPKADGGDKKRKRLPPLDKLQTSGETILDWIDYTTMDAETNWYLHEHLRNKLSNQKWKNESSTMLDFYKQLWLPFGEVLTDIERAGVRVDTHHLKGIQDAAMADRTKYADKFLEWADSVSPGCRHMNPFSTAQKQQLFFAPFSTDKPIDQGLQHEKIFKVPIPSDRFHNFRNGMKSHKEMDITIRGLGLGFSKLTPGAKPSVDSEVLAKLAGSPPYSYGTAKAELNARAYDGEAACVAIDALVKASAIDTLLTYFIKPLLFCVNANDRVHCCLNINTETGRLSARRPNLQNQPSLDKDIYKIRKAFIADPGKSLIVADYSQLELRILAHMSKCEHMIDAFNHGGDFQSRTAMGMYPEIREAVDQGTVLLEWDPTNGEKPPAPLVKDVYETQRRKAKAINFSLTYHADPAGLTKEWHVTEQEVQQAMDKWYADRPEVKLWQQKMIEEAKKTGQARTLLGRCRSLYDIHTELQSGSKHYERVALNMPLQGGAADIMAAAMVKLHQHEELKNMGWKQILQIHDELIFEGPEENAQQALKIIQGIMQDPLKNPLAVDLVVDAKIAKTWYDAKPQPTQKHEKIRPM